MSWDIGQGIREDTGVVQVHGDSTNRVQSTTASNKFLQYYVESLATSGEANGIYERLYVSGAGAEGIAARLFCTVNDVAAVNARGAHISLNFGTTGTISGLGAAIEATLHINTSGSAAGTLTAIKAAINSDGAASDPAGATSLSCIQLVNQGDSTGMADVDTDAVAFDFSGWTTGTGKMIYDHTGTDPTNSDGSIKIRLPDGALAYIMYYNQQAA